MSNLNTLKFYATPEHPCSYLEGELATTLFADPGADIDQNIYTQLTMLGFRRSGVHYYKPYCSHCSACIPVRVPVEQFTPNRSQRRTLAKCKDIKSKIRPAGFYAAHYSLYEKYINQQHTDGDMYPASQSQYHSFLVECPPSTLFVEFTLNQNLIAVAVVDELLNGLSAVYTFYDPEYKHLNLGTFAVLWQIEEVRRRELNYLFLGYWIDACRKMSYKKHFSPLEQLCESGWERIPTHASD
ncbi:MAG: arginyltransferase [Hahellaceae bacterium]|nr:arginyltransferase [Hahellaceae bacterium]